MDKPWFQGSDRGGRRCRPRPRHLSDPGKIRKYKQPRVSLTALSGLSCPRFPWSPEGFQAPPEPRSVPKVTPRPPVLRLDIATASPVPRSSLRAEARFEGASPSVTYCYVSFGSAVLIHSVTEAASFLSGCLLPPLRYCYRCVVSGKQEPTDTPAGMQATSVVSFRGPDDVFAFPIEIK